MIYTNKTFEGYYPVGTSAVVEAQDPAEAASKLNNVLKILGLKGDAQPQDMVAFPETGEVRILNDGSYS